MELAFDEMNMQNQLIIPEKIQQTIKKENDQLLHEVTDYMMDKTIKTIDEKYNQRMKKLNQFKQLSLQKNSSPMIFELINFNMYLILVAKNEKLAKWMLIN